MMRESLNKNFLGMNSEFRYRGKEPGRLENFSDAVFALAITLLLISTTPPTNFDQVKRFAFDLIPFLLCITLIITIWYEHYIFFFAIRNTQCKNRGIKYIVSDYCFVLCLPLKVSHQIELVPHRLSDWSRIYINRIKEYD